MILLLNKFMFDLFILLILFDKIGIYLHKDNFKLMIFL